MATAVGALSIDLSLNSAAFIRDAGKSKRALASNSAKMNKSLSRLDRGFTKVLRSSKKMAKSMVSMRGIMAGVAGAAGIGLLVKKSLDYADTLAKTARKIGFSTDALQELRFAAEAAGVKQATLDMALQRFSRRVGEAVKGSGELKDTLIDLGIAVTDATGKSRKADDVLTDLADAMARSGDAGEKLRIAFKAFDSEGAILVNVFGLGAAAAEKLRQRARDLGVVIDSKLLDAAARAKTELGALAFVLKSKVVIAVTENADAIANFTRTLIDGIPKIIKWVNEFAVFLGLVDASKAQQVAALVDQIDQLQQKMAEASDANLGPDFVVGQETVQGLETRIDSLRLKLEALLATMGRAREAGVGEPELPGVPNAAVPLGGVSPNKFTPAHADADFLAGAAQAAQVRRQRVIDEGAVAAATRKSTEEMIRQADQNSVLTTATRQGTEALRAQTEIFELSNAALAEGVDLTTQQGQAWEAAFRQNQIWKRGLEDATTEQEKANDAAVELATTLTDVVGQAIDGNIRSWQDLGKVAIKIIGDILQKQLEAAAQAKAAGSSAGGGGFFGTILGSLGSLFGGGSLGPQFTGTGAEGLAASGSFAHGGRGIVGGSGGTDSKLAMLKVTPREEISVRTPEQQRQERGSTGGGVSIEQNFDFRGADPGVFTRAQVFKEQIKQETVAAVFGLINEGGIEAKMTGRRNRQRGR